MITSMSDLSRYLRSTPSLPSKTTLTRSDALPGAGAEMDTAKQGIPVSSLKKIDMSDVKVTSLNDLPEVRDRMATMWL